MAAYILHPVNGVAAAELDVVLGFLASDIHAHPGRLKPVSPEFRARIEALTAGVEVELGATIEGAVTL